MSRRNASVGKMRYRVTIQSPPTSQDSTGQVSTASGDWSDVATIWGDYDATNGREYIASDQVLTISGGTVRIRTYSGLTSKHRLVVNGNGLSNVIVNIGAVLPPDPTTGEQLLLVMTPG